MSQVAASSNSTIWQAASDEREESLWSWGLQQLQVQQFPLLLLFTLFACGMWWSRFYVLGSMKFRFLLWNLFLAWLPFWFALGALWCHRRKQRWGMAACGLLWFLFFPNAPYLLTDLMHLRTARRLLWFDTLLLTAYALHGLFLGLIAMRMLHEVLEQQLSKRVSWCLVGLMMGLSGFAIYLGRFLRINSWDALIRPWQIASLFFDHVWNHGRGMRVIEVTLICFGLQMLSYLLFLGRPAPPVVKE